jgi:anti-sigma factor RsiW
MTELDQTWAESQIEAMADGTLAPDAERRMLAAMARDPRLAASVERARVLRRELRRLPAVSVPPRLVWRLWRIPATERKLMNGLWMPIAFVAAAASVALTLNVFFGVQRPSADDAARAAAVEDFTIVMAYLQKSAVLATNEVNQAVGSGVRDALAVSRGMLDRTETDVSQGDKQNVD